MRAFILLVTISLSSPAFAIQNLMNLCERNLMVAPSFEIKLAANQIALNGKLSRYWEASMEGQVAWFIGDEFIRRKLSPNGQDFVFWLSSGDRVFLQDAQGKVIAQGYFDEVHEKLLQEFGGMELEVFSNSPYLYADPEFTQVVLTGTEMRKYFETGAQAVVIKTMSKREEKSLKDRLGPAFQRYAINEASGDRFVRVGRRRGFELAHFQTAKSGKARVNVQSGHMQIIDMGMGDFMQGPLMHTFIYELFEGPARIELDQNDQILLLDENGLVTAEGQIGSPDFPWASDNGDFVSALKEKFQKAHSAFVAKVP